MADFLKQQVIESQSSDPIKEETARILDEARDIRARLNSEEAQKEYDELRFSTIGALKDLRTETHEDLEAIRTELGNSIDPFSYSQGEINQTELGNISREFNDLQELATENTEEGSENLSVFGQQMLGYIESTNDKILNGGEEELETQIGWYLTAFGSDEGTGGKVESLVYYGALTILKKDFMASCVTRLEAIQNSSESLETKLFQLSQLLYEVGMQAGAPSALEQAHNIATRNIIAKVIENDSTTFAVGFTQERGYYTTTNINSESSELEIGTYLCSLNKSGKLNKENLLQPNGPFSATELFDLIEDYKQGDFGGEEVRGLFTGYLTDFEENMDEIAKDYLANEQNGSHIIAFFNAQSQSNNNTPLYEESDIQILSEKTRNSDIGQIENRDIRERLLLERRIEAGNNLIEVLRGTYEGGPDIMDVLSAIIQTSVEGTGNDFDFSGINELISDYNEEVGINAQQYPLIIGVQEELIQSSLDSFYDAHMLTAGFAESLTNLQAIRQQGEAIAQELQRLQQAIISTSDSDRIAELTTQINTLRRESFLIQKETADAQAEVDRAEGAAEDELTKSEEYSKLLKSFTGSSINIDLNNPVHQDYILKDIPNRLRMIKNSTDILFILHHERAARVRLEFSYIDSEYLKNSDILEHFVENITIRESDYHNFPPEIFYDIESCAILGIDSHHWDILFSKITQTQGIEGSIAFIANLKESYRELFGSDNILFAQSIPQMVKDADIGNILGIPESERPIIDSPEQFNENVVFYLEERNRVIHENSIGTNGVISPIADDGLNGLNGGYNDDFGSNRLLNVLENLNRYIFDFGISNDIQDSIKTLIEAGQISSVRNILPNLVRENNTHVELAVAAVKKLTDGSYYAFLNNEMKGHPDVLKEIGKIGKLKTNFYDVSDSIHTHKQLAAFLEGFSLSGNKMSTLLYSQEMIKITENITVTNNSESNNLTDEEKNALDNFTTALNTQEENLSQLESFEEIHSENLENIRNIILGAIPEGVEIDFSTLESLMLAGNDNDYYRILSITLAENNVGVEDIKNILENVSNEIIRIRERGRDIARQQLETTLLESDIIYEGEYSMPDGNLNHRLLLSNFQIYVQENITLEELDQIKSPEFLEEFLSEQDFPEELLEEIRGEIITTIQAEITVIEAHFIAQMIEETDSEDLEELIDRGIGTQSQQQVYQRILSGEIDISQPIAPQIIHNTNASPNTSDNNTIKSKISTNENGESILVSGNLSIPVTKEDLVGLKTPEAEENFIKFYSTLVELNLEEFWGYKDIIFNTISNKSATSGLDLNDTGYIDESDMALFLYTVADSISESSELGNGEKNDINNMRGQKQNFNLVFSLMQRINKQTGLAEGGDETILRNEGRMGRIFRQMYFSTSDDKNEQSLIFNRERFENSLGK